MHTPPPELPTTPRLAPKRLGLAALVAGALLTGMVFMSLLQRHRNAQTPPPPPLPPVYEVSGDVDAFQRLQLKSSWAGEDRTPPKPPPPPPAPATPPPTPMFATPQVAALTPVTPPPPPPFVPVALAPPPASTPPPAPPMRQAAVQTRPPPATAAEKPSRHTKWKYLTTEDSQKPPGSPESAEQRAAQAGNEIIHPAKWAAPIDPLKTIYRSMRMNARLLDSINSDIPASTIRMELTTPLFDKFDYGTVILDKGTVIVAQQVGKAEFGQVRIPLKIEQIELISGEVIKVEGGIGDQKGAAGVPGSVDAHMGQLLLATGINAVLNLGLGYAVGQPGRGEHFEDPAQRAATDASRSVAQDINSYTRQVLRRPPTITVDAENQKEKFVTISLLENIQLHRPPAVAR